jgi:hypothetical protein
MNQRPPCGDAPADAKFPQTPHEPNFAIGTSDLVPDGPKPDPGGKSPEASCRDAAPVVAPLRDRRRGRRGKDGNLGYPLAFRVGLRMEPRMNIFYIIGVVVVVIFVLGFFGLR